MFLSFRTTFFVILTTCYCIAENGGDDCLKVPLRTENNVFSKIAGKWYLQQTSEEPVKKCTSFTVTSDDQKKNVIVINQLWENNKSEVYKLTQVKNSNEFPTIDSAGNKLMQWMIDLDSNSYTTWYICLPEETNKGFLEIITRDKTASNETIQKARDSFKKAGFDLSKMPLKAVQLTNCKN